MKNDSLQQYINLHRQLSEERSALQQKLRQIDEALGTVVPAAVAAGSDAPSKNEQVVSHGKRQMSPEGRARIAAAQKARWAAQRGGGKPPSDGGGSDAKPKRKMSAAARSAISAAAKRRWAAARASGRSKL